MAPPAFVHSEAEPASVRGGSLLGTAKGEGKRSSFWAGYFQSLKPLEVEEPIDVWLHRPLAYVLAKVLYPTAISPNLVTLASIVFGVAGGVCLFSNFAGHMQLGGLLIFMSAVWDCADGQLARMRKTSSAFGRMLDGVADLVVSVAAVGGAMYVVWSKFNDPWWQGLVALALCVGTAVTGSFHTGLYDHYKNVFLRMTKASCQEAEDYDAALLRFEQRKNESGFLAKVAWRPYLFYVRNQESVARRFDAQAEMRLSRLPVFNSRNAAIYSKHAEPAMRVWKTWFGFGSLVFGIALFSALDALEWYMLGRLVVLNAVFFLYLRPRQQEATRRAFREIAAT